MTPDRFAKGMTFDEYVAYLGSPENLGRQGLFGAPRRDLSTFFRQAYETTRLSEPQVEAIRWLQPRRSEVQHEQSAEPRRGA